jgi:hypothetical protein
MPAWRLIQGRRSLVDAVEPGFSIWQRCAKRLVGMNVPRCLMRRRSLVNLVRCKHLHQKIKAMKPPAVRLVGGIDIGYVA